MLCFFKLSFILVNAYPIHPKIFTLLNDADKSEHKSIVVCYVVNHLRESNSGLFPGILEYSNGLII